MLGLKPPPPSVHIRREGHDNEQSIDDAQQIEATGATRRTF